MIFTFPNFVFDVIVSNRRFFFGYYNSYMFFYPWYHGEYIFQSNRNVLLTCNSMVNNPQKTLGIVSIWYISNVKIFEYCSIAKVLFHWTKFDIWMLNLWLIITFPNTVCVSWLLLTIVHLPLNYFYLRGWKVSIWSIHIYVVRSNRNLPPSK